MPLSYSISDGILIGMICYVLLNMCCGKFKKISITMYILATLFILKYIFIVAEPKTESETAPEPVVIEQSANINPKDNLLLQNNAGRPVLPKRPLVKAQKVSEGEAKPIEFTLEQ